MLLRRCRGLILNSRQRGKEPDPEKSARSRNDQRKFRQEMKVWTVIYISLAMAGEVRGVPPTQESGSLLPQDAQQRISKKAMNQTQDVEFFISLVFKI